jgi:hypothetical protein
MQEDNPIPGHLKLQVSLVPAGAGLFRIGEPGAHTRMRHVGLDCNLGSRHRFASGIGHLEIDRRGADPGWLRRDFLLNRDLRLWLNRFGTTPYEQCRGAGEPNQPSCQLLLQEVVKPFLVTPLSLDDGGPTRTCTPDSPAPQMGTCGNTWR